MHEPALKLYHAPPSRSSIALWMLEELGEPFTLEVLDLKAGDQLKPAFMLPWAPTMRSTVGCFQLSRPNTPRGRPTTAIGWVAAWLSPGSFRRHLPLQFALFRIG